MQSVVQATSNAAVYAMLALGVSLVYGVLGVMNFAHGEFTTSGAYVAVLLGAATYAALVLQILVAVAIAAAMGALVYGLVLRPMKTHPPLMTLVSTFGLALVLQGVVLGIFGSETRSVTRNTDAIDLGVVSIPAAAIVNVVVAFVVISAVALILTRTTFGREMRAVAQNPLEATLAGIDHRRVELLAVALSASVAGIAGVVIAQRTLINPFTGFELVLKAFAIAIVAGLGRVAGIVPVALLLGFSESFVSSYVDATFSTVVIYLGLFLMLVAKPQGLVAFKVRA